MDMARVLPGLVGIFLLCGVCWADTRKEIKDEQGRINYSIGYQIGGDFKKQGWTLDPELLVQGIRDAVASTAPLLPAEQMNATLVGLKKKLSVNELADSKQKDAAFLAENAAKKGVVVLPSGVQYNVIKDGSGKKPTLKDSVTIKYQVGRVDGKEIATGYPGSPPKTYQMKQALPGLQEVLQMMKEGSVWRVVIPPGQRGGSKGEALENVGVLVYSLELISVQTGK